MTGIVIAATGPDVASVTSFSLRNSDGQVIDFTVGRLDVGDGGLPAPHLREHMLGTTPTIVYYVVQDGRNVAVKYVDAQTPPATP